LIEVSNRHQRKAFLDFVDVVYRDDPHYVRPLDREVEAIFDPAKNSFFTHGEACRWLLINDESRVIGRVAAFINRRKAFTYQQPTGGMGFFECIHDREAAFMLFDQCRIWLSKKGMLAMDGPINFGENDINWGLLVDGFIHPGFGMNYNPPWYRDFFESYGFQFYFEQVSNHLDLTKKFPERFWKIAEWVMKKPEITFRHFTFKHKDQYIHDMKEVYDDAWKFHENFTPMDESTLLRSLEKSRSFMDPEMIWFAYYNGEPAAFFNPVPGCQPTDQTLTWETSSLESVKIHLFTEQKADDTFTDRHHGGKTKIPKVRTGVGYFLAPQRKNEKETLV